MILAVIPFGATKGLHVLLRTTAPTSLLLLARRVLVLTVASTAERSLRAVLPLLLPNLLQGLSVLALRPTLTREVVQVHVQAAKMDVLTPEHTREVAPALVQVVVQPRATQQLVRAGVRHILIT